MVVGIGGKNGKKVKKRRVHDVSLTYASMKMEADSRGGFAVIKVGRD